MGVGILFNFSRVKKKKVTLYVFVVFLSSMESIISLKFKQQVITYIEEFKQKCIETKLHLSIFDTLRKCFKKTPKFLLMFFDDNAFSKSKQL